MRAGTMPLQHHEHGVHRLLDDDADVLRERRNRGNRVHLEWIRRSRPVAEQAACRGEDRIGNHVAGDDDRRVVGHVVLSLNRPHLLGRRREDHLSLAERILPAPRASPECLARRRRSA